MTFMISLIINADDLGSSKERDRGILEAFTRGVVTSASLLANGMSFASAVTLVRESALPVGVHLNLADGTTLTGPIEGLTDQHGTLPGKQVLRDCLIAGNCDQKAIRRELAAQIERVFDSGLHPDHLDSHQHCQLFPCISAMVTELALEHSIPAMRTSRPVESESNDPEGSLGVEMKLYRQFAEQAHAAILEAGLQTTDGLWGMPLLNNLDKVRLCQLLEHLPDGRWELMTHPGYRCMNCDPFNGYDREVELQALVSYEVQEIIAQRGIRLCSYGDLSCAF